MTRKFGLLIARQRSGTGALGTTIDRQRNVRYLGEVFHPNNVGQDRNYFTHATQAVAEDPELLLPKGVPELLDRFLDATVPDTGRLPILDVKYNGLHHLSSPWRSPEEPPWLIKECREQGYPIIHLRRLNLVEVFVSGRLAQENKVWHARKDEEISVTRVKVEPVQLLRFLTIQSNIDRIVQNWLGPRAEVLNVYYETMFDAEGNISELVGEQVSRFLGIPPFEDRSVMYVKQNRKPMREAIENFGAVMDALESTEFEWMLREPDAMLRAGG